MSYSRQKEVLEMPNLIEVQKDSYQWFLKEYIAGWSSLEARRAHNPKVVGSNPTPAIL